MADDSALLHWMLGSDPVLRWQVSERDCSRCRTPTGSGRWLGADVSGLAQWFLDHRLTDGGWNCEWVEASTRSSFHSTLNTLRSLLYYEAATGGSDELRAARRAGEEYLLQRRLLYRLSTGEQVDHWATPFAYPFRWFYSALNAADYFQAAAPSDGTWLQERRHPGRVWSEVDVPARRAVQMADVLRHPRARLVGSCARRLSRMKRPNRHRSTEAKAPTIDFRRGHMELVGVDCRR